MKSTGKCLSERYVLNGIIESRFCDAYAYIFDYMFNFILYNLSLLTLGFLFHHPIAVTIYIIITGSLRAVTGGYHCKTRISCYILSYTVFSIYLLTIATIPMISAYILIPIYIICWILILVVSPVDTPNKVFSKSAKKTARKKTYIIFSSIPYLQICHFCYTGIKV